MTTPSRQRGPISLFLGNRRFRLVVVTLVAAPMLYVGSFGPVCRCLPGDKRTVKTLVAIYYPLLSFVNWCQSVPLERALRSYGGTTGSQVTLYAAWEFLVIEGGDPPDVNVMFREEWPENPPAE